MPQTLWESDLIFPFEGARVTVCTRRGEKGVRRKSNQRWKTFFVWSETDHLFRNILTRHHHLHLHHNHSHLHRHHRHHHRLHNPLRYISTLLAVTSRVRTDLIEKTKRAASRSSTLRSWKIPNMMLALVIFNWALARTTRERRTALRRTMLTRRRRAGLTCCTTTRMTPIKVIMILLMTMRMMMEKMKIEMMMGIMMKMGKWWSRRPHLLSNNSDDSNQGYFTFTFTFIVSGWVLI